MKQFKQARQAGVPLIGLESADPAASIQACIVALKELEKVKKNEECPIAIMEWDICRGCNAVNKNGSSVMGENEISPENTLNPTEFLSMLANKVMECRDVDDVITLHDCVIFFHMGNRFIENEGVCQGIWNLRDIFKSKHCTLVILGPAITLPAELKQDVVVISEPLPGEEELQSIVKSIIADAGLKYELVTEDGKQTPLIVDTLRGLSAFAAEQVTAMSLSKEGVNMEDLWQRKRKMIEQTPGLEVWKGGESFDDLGGLTNLKEFLTRILTSGKTPVRAIGFIDEIEKSLAGASGDTSGTSQDQLSVLLKVMNDKLVPGIILIGPGGVGKSAIAKAAGTVANAPVIAIDMGAMKGSLVGQSEQRIRAAMDVFDAVSQGKGIFIATCNKIASLPPELRRRFTLGTFFVNIPAEDERKKIWQLWIKRYELEEKVTAEIMAMSKDWTGAECRACCDVAFRTNLSIVEASKYVVPVIKSAPEQVKALREMAHGRFIDASRPGIYNNSDSAFSGPSAGRKISLQE